MSDRERTTADASAADPHQRAAAEFVRRVKDESIDGVDRLVLFGSVSREEATGLDSDVDFLAVVSDSVDQSAVADELRDVAYDVMLDVGPVVEVHVLSKSKFERHREADHPFVRQALDEGETYPHV